MRPRPDSRNNCQVTDGTSNTYLLGEKNVCPDAYHNGADPADNEWAIAGDNPDLGGSHIVSYDIHAIDAAIWLLGRRPVAAMGASRIARPDPHGDAHDVSGVVFEYADGLIHEHAGLSMPTGVRDELSCTVYGQLGHGVLIYSHKAHFQRRGQAPLSAEVVDLYTAGAVRNIASFYADVTAGRCENPTVQRAVDGCLTCILGREAALRHGRLTMEELLKEDRRLEPDLRGLKA